MRSMAVAAAALLLLAGCADRTAAPKPVPSAAFQLDATGAVPWVDEQIERVSEPVPAVTVAHGSGPCHADQLTATMPKWWKPTPGAGGGGPVPARRDDDGAVGGKLIGEVDIRNTSAHDCTLQGEAPARLLSRGVEVPIHYDHRINEEAQQRVVPVPAGGAATLRLDWTGPYCGAALPPYTVRIDLPGQGGTLIAPVGPSDHPACSHSETHPGLTSYLSSGGFSPMVPPDPQLAVLSPLNALTVSYSAPATVAAGTRMRYLVTLRNPTAAPVTLNPCPGYLQELFSQGDASNDAVNSSALYRLNCRPRDHVDAHGSLSFEMFADVPKTMRAGRELWVSWDLRSAQNLAGGKRVEVKTRIA